jgi:hypothetical protein
LLLAAGLLTMAGAVAEGVREGLTLCVNVIVLPVSLYDPQRVCGPVWPGRGWRCRLVRDQKASAPPTRRAALYFMSLIGGYPVGARTMPL